MPSLQAPNQPAHWARCRSQTAGSLVPPLQDNAYREYFEWPVLLGLPVPIVSSVEVTVGAGFLFCPEVIARGLKAAPTVSAFRMQCVDAGRLLPGTQA